MDPSYYGRLGDSLARSAMRAAGLILLLGVALGVGCKACWDNFDVDVTITRTPPPEDE